MSKKHSLDLKPKASKDCLSQEQLREKISDKAYNLYEKRNCTIGNDLEDWLEAEKIVRQKLNAVYE